MAQGTETKSVKQLHDRIKSVDHVHVEKHIIFVRGGKAVSSEINIPSFYKMKDISAFGRAISNDRAGQGPSDPESQKQETW